MLDQSILSDIAGRALVGHPATSIQQASRTKNPEAQDLNFGIFNITLRLKEGMSKSGTPLS